MIPFGQLPAVAELRNEVGIRQGPTHALHGKQPDLEPLAAARPTQVYAPHTSNPWEPEFTGRDMQNASTRLSSVKLNQQISSQRDDW